MGVKKEKGRYVIRWTDETGHDRRRFPPRGTTKEEAEALLIKQKQRVNDIKDGFAVRDKNPKDMTVAKVADLWLSGKDDRLVNQVTNHVVKTELGLTQIDKVTPQGIRAHLESLKPLPPTKGAAKARAARLSPATRNHVRKHLVQIFKYAIEAGLLVGMSNPAHAVEPRKVHKRALTTYTAEECARLVNAVDQPWRGILAVALHGLRKGESWGLNVEDVDLARDEIRVHRSHDKPFTKGGGERVVPIIPTLRSAIVQAVELAEGRSVPLFPGLDPDNKPGEMLTKRRNERASVEVAYHRAIRLAKIGHVIRFHDLRHTAATLWLQQGQSIAFVSKILGHASIDITMKTYQHLLVEDLRKVMASVSFALPGPRSVKGAG